MKKILALLLAVVMCLSLVACGGGETPNTDNNSGTQQNEQVDVESTENNENDSAASEDESTQPDNSSAFLPYVCGEWKALYIKDEAVLQSVNILESGDVEINGSSYKYALYNEFENSAEFDIVDGEEKVGSFVIAVLEDGDMKLTVQMGTISNSSIRLYKPAHYEIISVSSENIYEYFEWQEMWKEKNNAFGELEYIVIEKHLVLKEPYFSRISQNLMIDYHDENVIENGAIEIQFLRSGLDVVVNLEEKTYTFENFKSGTEDTFLNDYAFGHSSGYFGIYAGRKELHPDSEGRHTYTWACPYDEEITRVKLDLYLIAE